MTRKTERLTDNARNLCFAFRIFLLVAAGLTALRPAAAGAPVNRVGDWPTSAVSTPDFLELRYEWPAKDQEPRRFLVLVPPGRPLEPEVLEADAELISPLAVTSDSLTNPAQWMNTHPIERGRMFASEDLGYLRHYRLVEIRIAPLLHGPNVNHRITKMRWVYRWKPPYRPARGFEDAITRRRDQGYAAVLSRLVVNPDAIGLYADPNPPEGEIPEPRDGLTFARLAGGNQRPLLRLSVDRKALYRLNLAELARLTQGAPLQLEHVQLYYCGQPTPLYLHRETGQATGGELIFYGAPSDSKYTRTNCYWLAEDPQSKPVRMAEARVEDAWRNLPPQPTFPEALVIEQDRDLIIHADNFLTILDFNWVWGEIPPADQPASITALVRRAPETKPWFTATTFSLPGLADSGGQTYFDVSFYMSSPQLVQPAQLEVRINGGSPQPVSLHESKDRTKRIAMANALLHETSNTIEIRFAPGRIPAGESIYFDRLVAHYRRRFDGISGGFTFSADPPTSTGWRHYAVRGSRLPRPIILDVGDMVRPRVIAHERDADGTLHFGQQETRQAVYSILSLDDISTPTVELTRDWTDVSTQSTPVDYLIISHRDFLDLLAPLVQSLSSAGWRVRLVDIDSVYASFSWGLSGPTAIKAFLAHALRNWPGGGPAYVLLVGDSTSDYRGDFRNAVKNFVPTYTYQRGTRQEKWASEHWFTTLCGPDEMPDIILGRLSVNSREDAKTVIEKVVRYRDRPVFDLWRARATYIADEGASFREDAEKLCGQMRPPALIGRRLYLEEMPWEDNFYLPPEVVEADRAKVSPVTTTRILDLFNEGTAFLSYNGHGSPNIWSNSRIWFGGDSPNSDIRLLRNGDRLPFIVNLTCNSGAIDYPDPPWNLCISEDFMRCPTGGAIGLFVPSGPGDPNTHMRFSEELHQALYRENLRNLGDIVTLTQARYVLRRYPGDMAELVKMFLFLGEPACPLQFPDSEFAIEADRRVLDAATGGLIRISGQAPLSSPMQGKLALFTPRDEERFSAPLTFAPDGRFESRIMVPASDETGSWTVRAYIWNEASRRDALGWTRLNVVRPDVAITRLETETPPTALRDGEPANVVCTVTNRSLLPVADARLEVYEVRRTGRTLVGRATVSLAGLGYKDFTFPWKPAAGFVRLESELSGPRAAIGTPAPENRRRVRDLAIADKNKPSAVDVGPVPVAVALTPAGTGCERRSTVTFGCVGAQGVTSVTVELRDDSTSPQVQFIGALMPSEIRSAAFLRTLDRAVLPREYHLTLRYFDTATSQMAVQEFRQTVSPGDFPDLVILGDQIVFRDRGNEIAFHDPRPTDGHTVFITVPVRNYG
ncbi:MAG: C25 family cysteine peptidase, partial [Candidatus Sumerlaeia bacterium]|nr:C25 family cysteine peptidase [Candidatus Sumerlaeia bacterium]